MASDFQIFSLKTQNSLHLKLTGDFDGSSAHELINTLIEKGTGSWNIFIDTNNLKTIHPFGIDVFKNKLHISKGQLKNLIFVGKNKYEIEQNDE